MDTLDFTRSDLQRFEELRSRHPTTVAARCLESNQYRAYHATRFLLLPNVGYFRSELFVTRRTNALTLPPILLAIRRQVPEFNVGASRSASATVNLPLIRPIPRLIGCLITSEHDGERVSDVARCEVRESPFGCSVESDDRIVRAVVAVGLGIGYLTAAYNRDSRGSSGSLGSTSDG